MEKITYISGHFVDEGLSVGIARNHTSSVGAPSNLVQRLLADVLRNSGHLNVLQDVPDTDGAAAVGNRKQRGMHGRPSHIANVFARRLE